MSVQLPDEAATIELGRQLAAALPADFAGFTILLEGDLGAGKSTLARALLLALGHEGAVPSPTYTLVEPYEVPAGTVYHVDLYRVADPEELRYLGWSETEEGLRLVEWPDRAPSLETESDLLIGLEYAETGRRARFTALSPRGAAVVAAMAPRQTESLP